MDGGPSWIIKKYIFLECVFLLFIIYKYVLFSEESAFLIVRAEALLFHGSPV